MRIGYGFDYRSFKLEVNKVAIFIKPGYMTGLVAEM